MKRPIVILDLETTGKDPLRDRIVQFSAVKMFADFSEKGEERDFLVHPGMPIPHAATAVNNITDEMVANKDNFKSHALSTFNFLERCDIAGFGCIHYDIPLLSEEFGRCGTEWPAPGTRFLDAMVIFKRMSPRTLSAALVHYCGLIHEEAHSGIGDVRATKMVIQSQMRQHPEVSTIDDYSSFCMNANALDFAGKIIRDESGAAVYNFGKHMGKPVLQYRDYATWMISGDFPHNTKSVLNSILNNE